MNPAQIRRDSGMSKVRRQPSGAVWAGAPWDGVAKPVEHVRLPATVASLVPAVDQKMTSLRRLAFGRLLTAVPWSGQPSTQVRVAFEVPAVPIAHPNEVVTFTTNTVPQEATA